MDNIKFSLLKKGYDEFYKNLLKSGFLPMRDTGRGFWNAAITDEVFELFQLVGLNKFRNFLDIGSGDGKVVLTASLFGVNATGIEIDSTLHGKANEMKKKFGLNADFIQDDFFNHNFSKYDVLFLNPDQPLYRGLEDKLLRELKGKLILYGPHFHPTRLKKEKEFFVNNTLVGVYTK